MDSNVVFIRIKNARIRVSTINAYSLIEFPHVSLASEKYKIKIVTSRSSFMLPLESKAEGEELLRQIDDILVINKEERK